MDVLAAKDESPLQITTLMQMVQRMFAVVPQCMAFIDDTGIIRSTNQEFASLLHLPIGSIPGHMLRELLPEFHDLTTSLDEVFRSGKPQQGVSMCTSHIPIGNQSIEHLKYHLYPITDPSGCVMAVMVFICDITDEVNAKKTLEEEKTLLNAVLDQMPAGVAIADTSSRIIMRNRRVMELWGRDIALYSDVASNVAGLAHHPDGTLATIVEFPLIRALRNGETVQGEEMEIWRNDGTRSTILVSAAPVYDASGKIVAAVVVDEDITDRKLLEQELRQSAEERARFLQVTAHELRNPMAAMKGVCALLQRRVAAQKPIGDLPNLLEREIDRLSNMLSEVLEAFRAQRGQVKMQRAVVDMTEVVRSALTMFCAGYSSEQFILTGLEQPAYVLGDAGRLEDVVRNLIGNAIKYSPPNSRVFLELNAKDKLVLLKVRDEGIGIPEDQLKQVFSGFYRASNVTVGGPSGIGLGLHICSYIVRAHGGRIWAESRVGEGATFLVELPQYVDAQAVNLSG